MAEDSGYRNIFKTTFLFGFVQIARLLVAVIKNKVIAILLGPSGVGTISIYNSVINLVKSGAGLGIYQSAVKDVSEANRSNNWERLSYIISVTGKIVLFTSFLGFIITIVLSPLLSQWGFSDKTHTIPFIFLSIAVAFEIFVDNALAILKGLRHLRDLAKASLIGSVVALLTGVPLFYLFGENGIVPSIIISSLSAALVAYLFISKIKYNKMRISWKESFNSGSSMIKMGVSLMMTNFLSYIFSMLVIGYIQDIGGLEDVGFYSAGSVLVISYFSMITTALNTDYYPRIAALSNQNDNIQKEITKQSTAGLVIMFPLVIMFVLFVHFVIEFLYSDEFLRVRQFTDIALMGTILSVVSNCLGYVLIAKQDSKIYLSSSIVLYVVYIPMYLSLYKFFGLYGLGISYFFSILMQLLVYWRICYKRYKITLSKNIIGECILIISVAVLSLGIRSIEIDVIKYIAESAIIIFASFYTIYRMRVTMNIDLIEFVKRKIWRS